MLLPITPKLFEDRKAAGEALGRRLFQYADENPVILALPRGGVPVGYEIAKLLHAPLAIIAARKIGLPHHPEFGIGAISENNSAVFDEQTLASLGLSIKDVRDVIEQEKKELKRRVAVYRGTTDQPHISGRTVIVVDDGLATGVTARAAIQAVKKLHPKKIIYASPVCAHDSAQQLQGLVDDVICLATPLDFSAVGLWYHHFDQVTDQEVIALLEKNRKQILRHQRSSGAYSQTGM